LHDTVLDDSPAYAYLSSFIWQIHTENAIEMPTCPVVRRMDEKSNKLIIEYLIVY